jgi:hypothetical protein
LGAAAIRPARRCPCRSGRDAGRPKEPSCGRSEEPKATARLSMHLSDIAQMASTPRFDDAPRRVVRQPKARRRRSQDQRERRKADLWVCPGHSGRLHRPSVHGSPLGSGRSMVLSCQAAAMSLIFIAESSQNVSCRSPHMGNAGLASFASGGWERRRSRATTISRI